MGEPVVSSLAVAARAAPPAAIRPRPENGLPACVRPDFRRPVVCLLGLPFDVLTMEQAARRVCHAAEFRQRCCLSTPNLNFVIASRDDAAFRHAVIDSDLSIVDGMPLVWLARLLGLPVRERLAGSDLFEFLHRLPGKPLSAYLFGGPPGVASEACAKLNADPAGIRCVGYEYPGYGDIEGMSSAETLARINGSGADLLLVSLGARKGQAWLERNRERLRVPVRVHLGAVMNHIAGVVRRAPPWMRRRGLEWLWRIREEPALWRRYAADGWALLRLLPTRILPAVVARFVAVPPRAAYAAARMQAAREPGWLRFRFEGAWGGDNLEPVRKAFDHATRAPIGIELDLGAVRRMDADFIGLLVLLYGHQVRMGLPFAIGAAGARVRRTLRHACAEYLLQPRLPEAGRAGTSPRRT